MDTVFDRYGNKYPLSALKIDEGDGRHGITTAILGVFRAYRSKIGFLAKAGNTNGNVFSKEDQDVTASYSEPHEEKKGSLSLASMPPDELVLAHGSKGAVFGNHASHEVKPLLVQTETKEEFFVPAGTTETSWLLQHIQRLNMKKKNKIDNEIEPLHWSTNVQAPQDKDFQPRQVMIARDN